MILKKSKNSNVSLSTSKINVWLKKSSLEYPHPLVKGKIVNFKYAVQVSSSPITIKIFSNYPKDIKKNYKNYLINKLIADFNLSFETGLIMISEIKYSSISFLPSCSLICSSISS